MRLFHGTYVFISQLFLIDFTKNCLILKLVLYFKRMESSTLLLAYIFYCIALYYNVYLEAFANTFNFPFPPRNHGSVSEY